MIIAVIAFIPAIIGTSNVSDVNVKPNKIVSQNERQCSQSKGFTRLGSPLLFHIGKINN